MNPIDLTDAFEEDRVLGGTEPYPPLDLPWERPAAPNAGRPDSPQNTPQLPAALREPLPTEVKADARQRAILWARTALTAWEKALDWIDIDDPTLPGDYPAEAKGIEDFIARIETRAARS